MLDLSMKFLIPNIQSPILGAGSSGEACQTFRSMSNTFRHIMVTCAGFRMVQTPGHKGCPCWLVFLQH